MLDRGIDDRLVFCRERQGVAVARDLGIGERGLHQQQRGCGRKEAAPSRDQDAATAHVAVSLNPEGLRSLQN